MSPSGGSRSASGLHGDHIGGERDAARALRRGEVDAACMIDGNHLLFAKEGTLPAGATRVIAQTAPYDHCNMSASATARSSKRFVDLLLGMDYADPVRPASAGPRGPHPLAAGQDLGLRALEAAVDATRLLRRRWGR